MEWALGGKKMKKILVVDDSALMRRVLCDIIEQDKNLKVVDKATNGLEALELIKKNSYDAVVLDVNMPKMNGLELLKELRDNKIAVRIMMASTDTREGAQTTLDALELGALDFVHKPDRALECRGDEFVKNFLRILNAVVNSNASNPFVALSTTFKFLSCSIISQRTLLISAESSTTKIFFIFFPPKDHYSFSFSYARLQKCIE